MDSIKAHGTDARKALYLSKMVSGEWTGSMNLTEPQAGSDVGALKSKAVPVGDGTYKITGSKIFITYGEHDMADNIVHLVLARLPDAPAGTKGIRSEEHTSELQSLMRISYAVLCLNNKTK